MTLRGVLSRDDELATPAAPPSSIASILVAVDASDAARKAVIYAATLTARFGARLDLVHVVDGHTRVLDETLVADAFELARRCIAQERRGGTTVERVRLGRPANEIVALARERSVDLIVTGTRHEPGKARLESGSVSGEVVLRAHVPVLVVHESSEVPSPGEPIFRAPLVAVDRGDASRAALRATTILAGGACFDVVQALREPAPDDCALSAHDRARAIEKARLELEGWVKSQIAPSAARARIVVGEPATAIADAAAGGGYDLVACGTRGRRPTLHPLLGSVAQALLDVVRCPVLVLREATG